MTELNQVFDGDLSVRVFLAISAVFIALYVGGILALRWTVTKPRRPVFRVRTALTALFLAVAITAIAGGLFKAVSSGAAKETASVSIMELQSAIDANALPEQQVADLF
jgi:hypothetical protein